VVATVTQEADLHWLTSQSKPALPDFLELRLDNLRDHLDLIERVIPKLTTGVRFLSTARHPNEGGANHCDLATRAAMYRRFLVLSDLIDTELSSSDAPEIREVMAEAQSSGKNVVISHHDFNRCPSRDELFGLADRAYKTGADIAKIAVVVNTFSELNHLVELVEAQKAEGRAISAMGMGQLGKISRLVLARAGSCLNYGYLQKPNASGQWSAAKLQSLLKELVAD
jgi:3-dehydroquinate dehydratase I